MFKAGDGNFKLGWNWVLMWGVHRPGGRLAVLLVGWWLRVGPAWRLGFGGRVSGEGC